VPCDPLQFEPRRVPFADHAAMTHAHAAVSALLPI
jgi:hypothetical protein